MNTVNVFENAWFPILLLDVVLAFLLINAARRSKRLPRLLCALLLMVLVASVVATWSMYSAITE